MTAYLLAIEYDGAHFAGWQVQRQCGKDRTRTVQSELDKILRTINGYKQDLVGASRTDAGVHAAGQAVSFSFKKQIAPREIMRRLQALLPEDIAPRSIKIAGDQFNARFSAKKKEYWYDIYHCVQRPVLERKFVWWRSAKLDIGAMRKSARLLTGKHDFKAFGAQSRNDHFLNTVCTIHSCKILKKGNIIRIKITGNRFLYHMARNIVGTLVEIGRRKHSPLIIKEFLNPSNCLKAGPKAPAQGLTLQKVSY
jgi:tRNA pseudouridine38-40 synthase